MARPDLSPSARLLLPIFAAILLFFTVRVMWCSAPARVLLGGEKMGTTWAVTLNAPDLARSDRARVRQRIQAELETARDASLLVERHLHGSEHPAAVWPDIAQQPAHEACVIGALLHFVFDVIAVAHA